MVRRQIKRLPAKQQKIIVKLAEALAINPRPPGAEKIGGMTGLYSEAVNSHRLIYKIEDQEILILLIK
jgi:mRNA interferase RelE/StbE